MISMQGMRGTSPNDDNRNGLLDALKVEQPNIFKKREIIYDDNLILWYNDIYMKTLGDSALFQLLSHLFHAVIGVFKERTMHAAPAVQARFRIALALAAIAA